MDKSEKKNYAVFECEFNTQKMKPFQFEDWVEFCQSEEKARGTE